MQVYKNPYVCTHRSLLMSHASYRPKTVAKLSAANGSPQAHAYASIIMLSTYRSPRNFENPDIFSRRNGDLTKTISTKKTDVVPSSSSNSVPEIVSARSWHGMI